MKRIFLNIQYTKYYDVIDLITTAKIKFRRTPAKLMQISAKSIFCLMSGMIYEFFDHDTCYENCKICAFERKFYNVDFNLKAIDFAKACNLFLEEALLIYNKYDINFEGGILNPDLDETIFFS